MSLSVETPIPVLYRSLVRGGWGALAGAEWQGVVDALIDALGESEFWGECRG